MRHLCKLHCMKWSWFQTGDNGRRVTLFEWICSSELMISWRALAEAVINDHTLDMQS